MDITDKLSEIMETGQKDLMSRGLYPHSALWPFAKMNLIIDNCRKLKVRYGFEEGDSKYVIYNKLPFIGNNNFLIFLNKILKLKVYLYPYYNLYGHKIWIKPNEKMNDILQNYQCLKIYEPQTTNIIENKVKHGDTCVDIGASIGYFTMLFSRLTGKNGRVVSIETTDFQQPYLKKNIEINGYKNIVKQVFVGAWDKDEIIKMPLNAPEYVQTELRCRPIDDVLEELKITKVDFIKIDVDGPEPKVLRGLIRTIERNPDLKMIIEYYPKYILDAKCSVEDFQEILDKYFKYYIIPSDYSDGCWNFYCERKHVT